MSQNKFDPTKPVRTRGGHRAQIVSASLRNPDGQPILAVVEIDGQDYTYLFDARGRRMMESETTLDLVNVEPAVWINIYRTGSSVGAFETRQHADSAHEDRRQRRHVDSERVLVVEIPEAGPAIPHQVTA